MELVLANNRRVLVKIVRPSSGISPELGIFFNDFLKKVLSTAPRTGGGTVLSTAPRRGGGTVLGTDQPPVRRREREQQNGLRR